MKIDIKNKEKMMAREIPSSGELIPVIGLGSWIQFDVGASENEREPLRKVLKRMIDYGGKAIDSSPMYGNAEKTIGDLTNEINLANEFFYATKVWTSGEQNGIKQMSESMQKMKRTKMDLMQIHNLVDWEVHLRTLRKWKNEGKIRYIGSTHYTDSAHESMRKIIESAEIDFIQINYSISDRNAEYTLFDTAIENQVGVIVNQPFGSGSLFKNIKNKALPEWAAEYNIKTWAQFFLKFIISHPAVTCVIPGTSDPENLVDNVMAGYGKMPDEKTREEMVKIFSK